MLDADTAAFKKLTKPEQHVFGGVNYAVRNIASVSKGIIAEVGKFYEHHEATIKDPFCYDGKRLSQMEIDFYTQCSTVEGVLDLHHQQITHTINSDGPYQLFPVHAFSEAQLQGMRLYYLLENYKAYVFLH